MKIETLKEARANSYIDFAKYNKEVDMYSFVAGFNNGVKLKDKPKQETLDEFAEWLFKSEKDREIFKRGAKLQEEKTIEEVFEWLTTNDYLTDLKETLIKDFKQFKNK